MIALIGLSLNLKQITFEGAELARSCDELFLDSYTSPIPFSLDSLKDLMGKEVKSVGREDLESDRLIDLGKKVKVGILTMGDPLTATTHSSLLSRAREAGVEEKVAYGISIITVAPSKFGLHQYKFGRIVTIPHPSKGDVKSPYHQIADNYPLHTLILLDSDPVLTAEEALYQLCEVERMESYGIFNHDRTICVLSRACLEDEEIWVGSVREALNKKFRTPSVLVLPGKLHFSEEETLSDLASCDLSVQKIENKVETEVLDEYISITGKALEELKGKELTDREKNFFEIGENYYKDALYFKDKRDHVRAYGAINYGHAFLDAIRMEREDADNSLGS
jgi:diphthine synthase